MQAPKESQPTRAPLRLEEILSEVREELAWVDQLVKEKAVSDVDLLEKTSRYIHQSGGKRVRPALLLLSAKLGGYSGPRARQYAAVMEYIHTATLVHDDIVDEATLRRGRTSLNSLLGNEITVLVGDYLYIRAMDMAIELGDLPILRLICDVTLKMIAGMLLELARVGDLALTEEEYLDILQRKTAYLFSGCAQIGAMVAGSGEERQGALAEYGLNLGMAFQIIDDLLDYTADEKVLGKPVLSDLKEGHLTLPILYVLRAEPLAARTVEKVVRRKSFDGVRREEILDLVCRHRALDQARRVAEGYAQRAKQALRTIPDSALKHRLQALADYVMERDR